MSAFTDHLVQELARSRFNNYTDNYDRVVQKILQTQEPPPKPPLWREPASHGAEYLVRRAFYYYVLPEQFFKPYAQEYEDVSLLYTLLGDTSSRALLVKLFAYRILGYRKVKLPRNCAKYWKDIDDIDRYKTGAAPIKIKFMDISLEQFDFKPLGYDLKVYATAPGSACMFAQQQYEYHRDNVHCKPEPGDITVDAGGCWGETTAYFAHEVGPEGKVVSFEFIPICG
jgi:hypothetical protein